MGLGEHLADADIEVQVSHYLLIPKELLSFLRGTCILTLETTGLEN